MKISQADICENDRVINLKSEKPLDQLMIFIKKIK